MAILYRTTGDPAQTDAGVRATVPVIERKLREHGLSARRFGTRLPTIEPITLYPTEVVIEVVADDKLTAMFDKVGLYRVYPVMRLSQLTFLFEDP